MDWYSSCGKYHTQTFAHESRLSSLPDDWRRELAALWRLEADINNGAYLQFLVNWGRDTYEYAIQGLKKIGASRMAEIIDICQLLVDEHIDVTKFVADHEAISAGKAFDDLQKGLPQEIVARIYELSYEFMGYPDDVASLGMRHYGSLIQGDSQG